MRGGEIICLALCYGGIIVSDWVRDRGLFLLLFCSARYDVVNIVNVKYYQWYGRYYSKLISKNGVLKKAG